MYCAYCGKQIPDNVKYCPECGRMIVKESFGNHQSGSNEQSEKKPVYKKFWFWFLLLLASPIIIPLLIHIVAFFWSFVITFITTFIEEI